MLKQTSPLTTALMSVTIGYVGSTIVGKATTLQLSVTPSADITNYILIKLPGYFLNRQYNLFEPVCDNASKT